MDEGVIQITIEESGERIDALLARDGIKVAKSKKKSKK